ncbi:amidohydrolase family protein [Aliikangiella coralliicola]|uniref:Amidohydrolase family protein n=1 Tax=Aliikangiella coralliicola TaxID=2592383 RepID=A0A545UIJ0_9GAMM|nr:amidohydrolase family protein [Aliikangiella coralliicola]TQV89275.1 amidohydrolase family protein [Aliikangiella coralliicola]
MKSIVKKLAIGTLILTIILTAATYLLFRSEIDHMLGGNTEVVDVTQFKTISGDLAITNVSVLSADSQSMRPNQTVLINDDTIVSVDQNLVIPERYHVIDGEGKFLIPGLVDSHVHIKKSKNDFLLYIANGITQIGEMTGMEQHFDYRQDIRNGAIGPGIFIASPKINSLQGIYPTIRSLFEKRHQNFFDTDSVRQAVKKFKLMGYDAIKLSSDIDADIYYAINDEAQKQKIPVIGHLPVGLQLDDLYRSGQSQLGHIDSITHNLLVEFGGVYSKNSQAFLEQVSALADSIAVKFKQNDIALASTVWLHKTIPQQDFNLADFLKSIELEYQNPGWLEGSIVSRGCLPGSNSYENPHNTDPESKLESEIYFQTYNKAIAIITQALVRHDVVITAGTDALGACGMIAGFSLHYELETLHELGLSNAQVLHSATLAPAKWMGTNAGIIESGFRADLVLLNKNPLENISNTRTINSVITKGKYLDRSQLDKILAAVKEANKNSRKVNIDSYLN